MPFAKPSKLKLSAEKQKQLKQHKKLTGKPIRFPVAVEARYVRELQKLTAAMVKETNTMVARSISVFTGDAKDKTPDDYRKEIAALEKRIADLNASTKRMDDKVKRQEKAAGKKIDSLTKSQLENIKKSKTEEAAMLVSYKKMESDIVRLANKYDALFASKAREVASKMILDVNKASAIHLNGTLKELSGQLTIKMDFMNKPVGKEIRAALFENTKLIRSIPDAYMARVQKTLHQAAMRGGDMTGLTEKIAAQGGISERRAKNIALDQTRKTYATINQKRMAAVGIKQFEWVHSGGGANPREFHMTPYPAGLNGGIFDINDPPVIDEETGETGFPADLPNCKCVMAPVISFDEFDDENWTEPDEE